MASTTENPTVKKKKSSAGLTKKSNPYNRFLKSELKKLKEEFPDVDHRERFRMATANWQKKKEEKH